MTERRTLTPAEIEGQRRGSTRIAPGIWQDREGGLHFSIPEILDVVGLSDTPGNRQVARDAVHEFLATHAPGQRVVEQDPES